MGVALVELPAAELEAMDLPENLYDAVVACRRITAHGARLRQEMYIAKVMRGVDVEPIRIALERRSEIDRQRVRREHVLEQWRDRLLADEAGGLDRAGDADRPGRTAAAAFAGAPGTRGEGRSPAASRLAPAVPPTARRARKARNLEFSTALCTMAR